jgi:hypothetical protein
MLIAQGALPHVGQLDGPLRAGVHEPVAAHGVELGRCDHLGQLLHVRRLDVDNVEALVLDVEVPQVDTQVVTADECLPVTVYRDAVDVVGVGVGVGPPGHGGHHGIVVGQPGELEVTGIAEVGAGQRAGGSAAASYVGRGKVVREIVLGHHLEGLLKHLPELDGLVVC